MRRGTNPAQQDNIGTLQDPPPISLSDIEKVNGTSEKDEEDEDATPNHSPPSTPVDQWKPQQQPSLQQQPTQQPSFQQQPTQQQQPSFQQQEPQQQWQSQQTSMGQWQPPPLEQQSSHDQWQPQQQSSFQQHQGTNGQWQPQQQQQWQPQPQQQLDQQLQLDQQQQQDQQQRSSPPIWGVQKQGGSSAFIATEPPPLHPPQAGASDPGLYSYPGSLYQNYDSPQQKRNASSFSQYGGSFQPANSGNDNGGGVSPPSNPDSTPPPTRGRAFSLLPGDLWERRRLNKSFSCEWKKRPKKKKRRRFYKVFYLFKSDSSQFHTSNCFTFLQNDIKNDVPPKKKKRGHQYQIVAQNGPFFWANGPSFWLLVVWFGECFFFVCLFCVVSATQGFVWTLSPSFLFVFFEKERGNFRERQWLLSAERKRFCFGAKPTLTVMNMLPSQILLRLGKMGWPFVLSSINFTQT